MPRQWMSLEQYLAMKTQEKLETIGFVSNDDTRQDLSDNYQEDDLWDQHVRMESLKDKYV